MWTRNGRKYAHEWTRLITKKKSFLAFFDMSSSSPLTSDGINDHFRIVREKCPIAAMQMPKEFDAKDRYRTLD